MCEQLRMQPGRGCRARAAKPPITSKLAMRKGAGAELAIDSSRSAATTVETPRARCGRRKRVLRHAYYGTGPGL